MENIKKNKYGNDMVQISLNVPVKLLFEYDSIALFLNLERSQVMITALSSFKNCLPYNSYENTRNYVKRTYRKEHKQ